MKGQETVGVGWTGFLASPSWQAPFSNGQAPIHPLKPTLAGLTGWVLAGPTPPPSRCQHPPYRPTSSSSRSPARGRSRLQMSMVKSVLLLLKMEVSDDMSAAIITAIIRPRRPVVRDAAGWPACPAVAPPAVAPPAAASGVRPSSGPAGGGGRSPRRRLEAEDKHEDWTPHHSSWCSQRPSSLQSLAASEGHGSSVTEA